MATEIFTPDPKDVQDNRAMGILAYISILVLIPIFAAKESPFARFHANQGLILFLIEVAVSIISKFLGGLFVIGFIISLLMAAINVVCVVFSVLGIVNAAKGKCVALPIIGGIQLLK